MQIAFYKIQRCPECGEQGQFVKNITAKHLVKKNKVNDIGENDCYFCRTPSCGVGYFNTDHGIKILKDDFKRPIWLKDGSDPVIACYCTNIKEDDIIKTVVETDLTELQPIMLYLHGSIGDKCQFTNPTGHCCTAFFNECIEKGIEIKGYLKKYGGLNLDSKKVLNDMKKKLDEMTGKKTL